MNKYLIILLILLILPGCYSNLMHRGRAYEKRGDQRSAIDSFAAASNSGNLQKRAIAQAELGRIYRNLGMYEEALQEFEQATVNLPPDAKIYAQAHLLIGLLYYEKGDQFLEQAKTAFHVATASEQYAEKANLYLGMITYKLRNYQKTIEYCNKVKGNDKTKALYYLALAYAEIGEYDLADEKLESARATEQQGYWKNAYADALEYIKKKRGLKPKLIAQMREDGVVPALYHSYAQESIGTVSVHNPTSISIGNAELIVDFGDYTSEPTKIHIGNMSPGGSQKVNVTAKFSDKILEISKLTNIPLNLTLKYNMQGRIDRAYADASIRVNSRNAFDWTPPKAVAAFVTSGDSLIQNFASKVCFGDKPLDKAIQIYNALNLLGIRYQADPNSTWGKDTIHYPRETLQFKNGDCDDVSVLYAACLESVGIEAGLALTPTHIFVMFNTEIPKARAQRFFIERGKLQLYGVHNDTAWVPVETTKLGKSGFYNAWMSGAETYHSGEVTDIVFVHAAWQEFKAQSPNVEVAFDIPEEAEVERAYKADVDKIQIGNTEALMDKIQALQQQLKEHPEEAAAIYNIIGIAYAQLYEFSEAEEHFRKAVMEKPSAAFYNNLANVLFLQDNPNAAKAQYQKAMEEMSDNDNFRINFNLFLFYYMQGNKQKVDELIAKLSKHHVKELQAFLGIQQPGTGRAAKTNVRDQLKHLSDLRTTDKERQKVIDEVVPQSSPDVQKDYESALRKLPPQEIEKIKRNRDKVQEILKKTSMNPDKKKLSEKEMFRFLRDRLKQIPDVDAPQKPEQPVTIGGTRGDRVSEPEGLQWWLYWLDYGEVEEAPIDISQLE